MPAQQALAEAASRVTVEDYEWPEVGRVLGEGQ